MEKSKKTNSRATTAKREVEQQVSTMDNIRLISGFVFMLIGAFIFCSVVSYIFYWKQDMSALAELGRPMSNPEFCNICGEWGAKVAHSLVGKGFGLFALVIPMILSVIGWRLFRYKPLRLHRFLLIFSLVLVLGSLTFGFIFGTSWGVFGSGLGGEYGLAIDIFLSDVMGAIGTLLVIVAGWILTGLLIDRNFLRVVDSAGEQVVGGLKNVTTRTINKMQRKGGVNDTCADGVEDTPQEERVAESDIPEPQSSDDIFVVEPCDDNEEDKVVPQQTDNCDDVNEPVEDDAAADSVEDDIDIDKILGMESDDEGGEKEEDCEEEDGHNEEDDSEEEESDVADGGNGNLVITVTHNKPKVLDEGDIEMVPYDPTLDIGHYEAPTPSLLIDYKQANPIDEEEIFKNKERIRETLLHFHIPIISMTATVGPTVTLYEIVQEPGVKISRILGLEDDLAQHLKAQSVRIIAPIPGKGTVGIEVPNQTKQTVSMRSAICSPEFQNSKAELPVVIGRTIQNENYTFDLAKLPHLLVAGATGQGKSVGLNAIIASLLYRKHPSELKFVLIDPKMVEFSLYNRLEKHFLAKMESEDEAIVTDPKKAVYTLNAMCTEMANRLELCKMAGAKNIVEYNDKFVARRLNPENGHRYLPYIVVVIDEFADLIMTAKEVEKPVMRLAQKARAVGIHLIVATQRPDVKVITGGIKANFPARIAFRVMQMTDSRTIIDQPGANQLIGRGDMLFLSGGEPVRIQCAFIDTPEVERVVEHIGAQQGYTSAYNLPDYVPESGDGGMGGVSFGSEESGVAQKYDPKFAEIARAAVTNGVISTSMIQRSFEVGFNRAGRIMMQLERAGIVGPQIGAKPREIKFYDLQSLEAKLQDLGVF
jgi:S-DNA-T family DNA segregation ATPase FtsK/SpoIIIE